MAGFKDIINSLRNNKELKKELKEVEKGYKELKGQINTIKGTSLAKLSSAATLQFPIIISKSVNVDTAQAVSKALERQYATFIQIVISLDPNLRLDRDKDIAGYLRRYHQNNIGPNDLLESNMSLFRNDEDGIELFMSINEGCNAQVLNSNKEQLFCVEECLNTNKVNDLYKPETITRAVAESSLDYFCRKNDIVMEAKHRQNNKNHHSGNNWNPNLSVVGNAIVNAQNSKNNNVLGNNPNNSGAVGNNNKVYKNTIDEQRLNYQKSRDKELDQRYEDEWDHKLEREKKQDEFQNRKFNLDQARLDQEIRKDEMDFKSRAMVRLSDNDVKKCNELVPTTLSLSLNQIGDNGKSYLGVQNFVVGVKGLMHPVNSNEMITNLLDGFKSGNKFFNFLRWTTGEIKFIKDLLFNIGGIKDDVIKKHSNTSSHWWSTLKRRRTIARASNAQGKQMLPNASIVCTMEEVVEMQEVYKINLLDVRNIKRIMDRYYLLGFVIVDEAQELCHIIFDGEDNFQVLTYKGLERENNSKNDFKDIYKMINSGRI